MDNFGLLERKIGKMLDKFPHVRFFLKRLYQRLNYIFCGQKGFRYQLREGLSLFQPNTSCEASFLGYYDKSPWRKTSDCLIYHVLEENCLKICLLENKQERIIGKTTAWNFQQGSMLQWCDWDNSEQIIYNEVSDNILGSVRFLSSFEREFCPWPIQTIHPKEAKFISLNYLRLNRLRPEYGYNVCVKNFDEHTNDCEDGLWKIAWPGKVEWFVSISRLKQQKFGPEMENSEHKINHAIYSPSGNRIVFMHRWIGIDGKFSRLYVIDDDGANLKLLLDNRMVSHYNWKNDNELVVWGRGDDGGDHYFLIDVTSGEKRIIMEGVFDIYGDGHPSFSPCGRYILTDSYPDRKRQRKLVVLDLRKKRVVELGRFFEPWAFYGPTRCDLHPRWSPDGNMISFDSAHSGKRQTYVLENIKAVLE